MLFVAITIRLVYYYVATLIEYLNICYHVITVIYIYMYVYIRYETDCIHYFIRAVSLYVVVNI